MDEFGSYLRDLRGKDSLRKVQESTGISHTYLSTLEKGFDPRTKKERKPSFEVLKKLANYYEVSYIELLQKAGYIEEAEKEGLMKSADLHKKYRQKKNTDLKEFYKENRFDIEELLSYDTTLIYRSVILSKNDKDKILTFIKDILLNDKDGE